MTSSQNCRCSSETQGSVLYANYQFSFSSHTSISWCGGSGEVVYLQLAPSSWWWAPQTPPVAVESEHTKTMHQTTATASTCQQDLRCRTSQIAASVVRQGPKHKFLRLRSIRDRASKVCERFFCNVAKVLEIRIILALYLPQRG